MNYFRFLTVFILSMFLISVSYSQNSAHTTLLGIRETDSGPVGVSANITVHVKEGTGHVFIDTMPLTQIDTQASARLAREVACATLKKDCSAYDFYYIIRGEYQFIGGPSAGAAMAVATLAAIQGVPLNSDVVISGTINPSGDIGPVGGLLQKAEASYLNNASIFLIPSGHAVEYVESLDTSINIINYARDNWQLRVIEAPNIIDAYKYMSGYEIIEPKIHSSNIVRGHYSTIMKGLSEILIRDAQKRLDRTITKLGNSTLSFFNANEINQILKISETELENSRRVYTEKQYYSSASLAVRSYIQSVYADNKIDYLQTGTNETVYGKMISVRNDISSFETGFLRNRNMDSIDDIEIFAVVIDRISESENTIAEAFEAYKNGDIETAIYLTAYAEVRKNTAYNWLTTVDLITGDKDIYFDHHNIKPLSQERVEQSRITIAYAKTVVNNNILLSASEHQLKAEKALEEGKYVFALFESAKARAEANLAMEIRALTNATVYEKISSLEKDAQKAIVSSGEQGYIPILALSYLEFGTTLKSQNPIQSLIYLSYSKEMATISRDLIKATLGEDFIPAEEVVIERYYERVVRIDYSQRMFEAIMLVLSGTLLGIVCSTYLHQKKKL